jgi:hypothetical protein
VRRVLALLLALSGCLPVVDQQPPQPCALVDAGVAPLPEFLRVGRPAVLELAFEATSCLPEVVFAVADVRDAENLEVPVAQTLRRAGRTAVAALEFTPGRAGLLSVTVRFEPTLAVTSATLPVVAGPSAVGIASSIAQPCVSEGITSRGAWVCQESAAQVSVWRGGERLQALAALDVTVAGDDVWLRGPGRVERFVDRGGPFLSREPDVALLLSDEVRLLAAGEGRALVRSGPVLSLVAVGPAGLDRLAEATVPRGLCEGEETFVPASDGQPWLACPSRSGFSRLCAFDLADIGRSVCREVPGDLVGLEPGAVWTSSGAFLARWGLSAAQSLPVPRSWRVGLGRAVDGAAWPVVTTPAAEVLLAVSSDDVARLEAPAPGVRVLGHGPRGVLVESGARRSLLPRSR